MGKICVIKSCPSGRKLLSKKNGWPQSVSYFQPTTEARLQNWTNALGIELKVTDYVCHFHFRQEQVRMFEKCTIQGQLHIMPFGKKTLTHDAVPTICHQFIPSPDVELSKQYIFNESYDTKEPLKELQEIKLPNYLQQINPKVLLPKDPQEFEPPKDPLEIKIPKYPIEIDAPNLPPYWLYTKPKPDGFMFMRIDPKTLQVKIKLRLNMDTSVNVILPNNDEVVLKEKINSLTSVYEYLESVEKLSLYSLIDSIKYSKQSENVNDDTHKNNQAPTCDSCVTLRNKLQSLNSTIKTSAENTSTSNVKMEYCKLLKVKKVEDKSQNKRKLREIEYKVNKLKSTLNAKLKTIRIMVSKNAYLRRKVALMKKMLKNINGLEIDKPKNNKSIEITVKCEP